MQISNAVEAGGLSPRSNRLVAALAYLERADASTGSSRPRTPPPRERADASTGSSRPRTPPPRERADASTGSSRPRTPPPRPRPRPIQVSKPGFYVFSYPSVYMKFSCDLFVACLLMHRSQCRMCSSATAEWTHGPALAHWYQRKPSLACFRLLLGADS